MKTSKNLAEAHPETQVIQASSAPTKASINAGTYRRTRGISMLYQSFISALQALRANKLRALLTSLGIIIGVGAVIMMISISEGNAAIINQRLSALSPNELIIRPGSASSSGVNQGIGTRQILTPADASAIARQVPGVVGVSPVAGAGNQVIFRNQNWATQVQGVYPSFQHINNWQMQEGTFITSLDEQNGSAVAVIGQTVANNLFTPLGVDPIGQQIRIGNVPFTVIGVLASKGANALGNADDVIYVPFSTAQQRLIGGPYVNAINVLGANSSQLTGTENTIQQLLDQRHNISDPSQADFTIQNQEQILQTAQGVSQSLTILLVSVAAVSLLVGGIGIMNIMLVSVTERTREIGIRMAIGARPSDVMTQFLIEAVVLSILGGAVGILLGLIGAFMSAVLGNRPFVLDPLSMLLAFGFAAVVGIAFGFYPAQHAARLDPIVALRTA